MSLTIRAHFDGKVIIPHEPVDLPPNELLDVELRPISAEVTRSTDAVAALVRVAGRGIPGLSIPDEALRRESLYEDVR